MKPLLLFTAHPKKDGTATVLAEAFRSTVPQDQYTVEAIDLYELKLPTYSLQEAKDTPEAVQKIRTSWEAADTLAFFLPNWWGVGPAPLVDLINWMGDKIISFSAGDLRPKPLMKGKTVVWITTGMAPSLFRKIFFQTTPEKWGKYIFKSGGAQIITRFFDGAKTGEGHKHTDWEDEVKKIAEGLGGVVNK